MKKAATIGGKLVRISMLISTTVLVISTSIFALFSASEIKEAEHRRLITLSRILAFNLSSPLAFSDYSEAQKILSSLEAQKIVRAGTLTDLSGKIVAKYGDAEQLQNGISEFHIQIPVKSGEDVVGTLLLLQDQSQLNSLYRNYFIMVIVILSASLFIAYLISYLALKPIAAYFSELIKVVKKVSAGDYSVRFHASEQITDVDELRLLTGEFDRMIDLVELRSKMIKETNENLENVVIERTRQLEQNRARQIESAKMAVLGEMAGGVAHEINTPLTSIILTTQIIQRNINKGELEKETILKKFETVEKLAFRISKIIKALRYFSRDAQNDLFEIITISSILHETLELCSEKLKTNGISFSVEKPETEISIEGRGVQISQVLLNLIGNSSDAIRDLPEKWIRINYGVVDNGVEIRVADSGKGITPEIQEKIFNPFFTTKDVGRGTGIGLSISKGIIEDHGGKLYLDVSAVTTTFVVFIPKHQNVKTAG